MADEPIDFKISDGGTTAAFTALLEALGAAGETAFNNLTAAAGNFERGSKAAQAAQQLMNQYMAAGGRQIQEVGAAFLRLTSEEIEAAGAAREVVTALQNLGVAEQAVAQRAKEAADAFQQEVTAARAAATELAKVTSGQQNGTSIALAYRQAHYGAADATAKGGAAANSVQSAYKNLGGAISQVTAYTGAYVSAMKVISSIDAVDTVTRQIGSLVTNAQEADTIFNRLSQTAIAVQQPLEGVTRGFTQIYGAIKDSGGSADEAARTVDNLSRVFQATGVTGQAATRVLHDIAEGLAAGTLGGQQLRSMLLQAGASLPLLNQALGVNLRALTSHSAEVDKLTREVAAMKAEIGTSSTTVKEAQGAVNKWTNELDQAAKRVSDLRTKLNDTTYTAKQHKEQQLELTRATTAYNLELPKLNSNLSAAKAKLGEASTATEAKKRASLEAKEAALAHATALSQEALRAGLSGEAFTKTANELDLGVGTIGGAFTALNTRFEQYLKQTGEASLVTRTFNTALTFIGNNLPIIIPSVIAFGTAWAAAKLVTVAQEILAVGRALTLAFITNPVTAAILAIGVAIVVLANHTETGQAAIAAIGDEFTKLSGSISGVKAAQDSLATSTDTAGAVTKSYQLSVTNLTNEQISQLKAQRDLGGSQDELARAGETLQKANNDNNVAIKGVNDNLNAQTDATTKVGDAIKGVVFTVQDYGDKTVAETAKGAEAWGKVGTTISGDVNKAIETSKSDTVEWSHTVVQSLDEIIAKAKEAAEALRAVNGGGAGGPGLAVPGISRDGSSFNSDDYIGRSAVGSHFIVPGASGVDSRLIAVSPGEHVTIQTPMQAKDGTVNNSMPKFRDGGQITLEGLKATFTTEGKGTSITGFATVADTDYYTNNAAVNTQAASKPETPTKATPKPDVVKETPKPDIIGGISGGIDPEAEAKREAQRKASADNDLAVRKDKLALDAAYIELNRARDAYENATGAHSSPSGAVTTFTNPNGQSKSEAGYNVQLAQIKVEEAYAQLQHDSGWAFRDGGEFTVPGGSGVDSRMIQLAVSPGESVAIKTPMQQDNDRRANGQGAALSRGVTVIQNIKTDDANSFGKSKSQRASDLKRQLAKVS